MSRRCRCGWAAAIAAGLLVGCSTEQAVVRDTPPPLVETQRDVGFSGEQFSLDTAIPAARIAVVATIDELLIDPVDEQQTGPTAALGRRLASVTVDQTIRGDLARGSTAVVWYGTELKPGSTAAQDANLTIAPQPGDRVLVLAENLTTLPNHEVVVVPTAGAGLGIIDGDDLTTSVDESVRLDAVTERLEQEPPPPPLVEPPVRPLPAN